ncbi:AcrR family transcriptional regulator [Paraburkholderia sp. GAS448]|uniref:TetR/AcrR family transcriptional regulator n=1 Tax=Paraburkholderia sp. GAS448 TaxID=3035136 RepID=UPI003D1D59D2
MKQAYPAANIKKQHLIETATRLFNRHGYHAVGIDRIIQESDVAKMTMYRHFPSKDSLVSEVLQQRMGNIQASISESVATRGDALDKLREVFLWHGRWFDRPDFHGCMFIAALSEFGGSDSEIIRVATVEKQRMREFIQNIVVELVRGSAAARLTHQIVMLLDGAIISAQTGKKRRAALDAWEAAKCLVATQLRRGQVAG